MIESVIKILKFQIIFNFSYFNFIWYTSNSKAFSKIIVFIFIFFVIQEMDKLGCDMGRVGFINFNK